MKPHIEVAAAIIMRRGKLLISQRDAKSHLSGYWEFPGGKREAGESFEECLLREVREELNVKVKIQKLLDTICFEYPEKQVTLKFFRCSYLEGQPKALGCLKFLWVSPARLSRYRFPPADRPIVTRIINGAF